MTAGALLAAAVAIGLSCRGSGADWTLGCIALDDPDMKRLYETVRIGSPVEIRP